MKIEVDGKKLKESYRQCMRVRNALPGECEFLEELGSCWDCSFLSALAYIVGEDMRDAWYDEIMAELKPEIRARGPVQTATVGSAMMYDLAVEVTLKE